MPKTGYTSTDDLLHCLARLLSDDRLQTLQLQLHLPKLLQQAMGVVHTCGYNVSKLIFA